MHKDALTIVILLLIVVVATVATTAEATKLDLNELAIDETIAHKINSDPTSSWYATTSNAMFEGKTIGEIKQMFNLQPTNAAVLKRQQPLEMSSSSSSSSQITNNLPTNYNTDVEYPQCIVPIATDGSCGASWAQPISSACGNRYCIAAVKQQVKNPTPLYSTQYLMSCDKGDFCCSGGYLNTAYDFVIANGLPVDKCMPYVSGNGTCPNCPTKCVDGSPVDAIKLVKPNSERNFTTIDAMKQDILDYGYIATGLAVYRDLLNYKGGVYQHLTGGFLGYDGFRLQGWGYDTTSKLPYWIVAASFGPSFGMKGYIWIKAGNNECQVESFALAITPINA